MLCLMSITDNLENGRRGSQRGEKKKKTTTLNKKFNEVIAMDEDQFCVLIETEELTSMTAVWFCLTEKGCLNREGPP